MKKKLSLLLCLVCMVLGLAACGPDPRDVDYFGMSYEEFEYIAEQNIDMLSTLTEEQKQYFQTYNDEVVQKLVNSWSEATQDLGAYVGLGEFTISKTQDTVTTEQIAVFEEREVCVTFVYEYNYESKQLEQKDINADLVYTLGEKMGKAGLNTLMGMGTVFIVLILISLIIYAFNLIPVLQKKFAGTKEEEPAKETVVVPVAPVTEQLTDDLELVAVITAAVAASEGTPADGLVVRSIRRR